MKFDISVLKDLSFSWVDALTIIILVVGFIRGRKRGLSEEILDMLMWVAIVVLGGMYYKQVAVLISQKPMLSPLAYAMIAYALIAMMLFLVFSVIKRRFGQKIVESDMFGRIEFYAGMIAGMVRFSCVFIFLLSFFHAPVYTAEELAARQKAVEYNYGSDFFPSIDKIQKEIFQTSFTGRQIHTHLARLIIEPTSSDTKAIRNENSMGKRREREIDSIMGAR